MSALRRRMRADMVLRGLAYRTRKSYVEAVVNFAKFYGRSPERITEPECQSYLLHLLQERKLAHSSCNVVASALQFLYRVTLKHPEAEFNLPRPRVPQRLPQILSREDVAAIFEHAPNLKHRAFLMCIPLVVEITASTSTTWVSPIPIKRRSVPVRVHHTTSSLLAVLSGSTCLI